MPGGLPLLLLLLCIGDGEGKLWGVWALQFIVFQVVI